MASLLHMPATRRCPKGHPLALGAAVLLMAAPLPVDAQRVAMDERDLAWTTAANAGGRHIRADSSVPDNVTSVPEGTRSLLAIEAEVLDEAGREIELSSEAQGSVRAVNLVNAAGSDSAQGVNVMLFEPGTDEGAGRARSATQRNEISQAAAPRTESVRYSTDGPRLGIETGAAGSSARAGEAVSRVWNTNLQMTSTTTTTEFSATAEPVRIGLFDDPVSLEAPPIQLAPFGIQMPSLDVSFSVPVVSEIFDLLDIDTSIDTTLSFGLKVVDSAELSLGDVTLHGTDVIFSGPSLKLPDLTFSACFRDDGCQNGSDFAAITIPGGTFDLGDITLHGANPLGEIGIGFGYAAAGDGRIQVDAGSVEFSGAIPLDLGLVDIVLDVLVEEVGSVGSIGKELDLPEFEVPIELTLEFPEPDGLNTQFASQACTLSSTGRQCQPLDVTTQRIEHSDDGRGEEHRRDESVRDEHLTFAGSSERGALSVLTGQSEITALRDTSVERRRYNVVVVTGGAQSRIGVVNAVNGAAAVVGNGVNVAASAASGRRNPGVAPHARLRQSNAFDQIGIR